MSNLWQTFRMQIPTWRDGAWVDDTIFEEKEEFIEFALSTFKKPGEYGFDETSRVFNEQGRAFDENGYYCNFLKGSYDFINYWEYEKQKSVNGAIFHSGEKTWYLPRDYYFWINFLQINNKMAKKYEFPYVLDVQLYLAMYELLAELHGEHASVFKKRQIASSYFHAGKLINRFWFDEGAVLKMGASQKDYVNIAGTWKFLEEYRAFLNKNTAWYRPTNPGSVLKWEQKIEVVEGGREFTKGNLSRITGMSFEQHPTKGVGGPCSVFFYEEGGIAPTADQTYIYLKSAMEMGELVTGIFVIAGSVGKLKDAQTLKEFTLNPEANGIYAVDSDIIDDKGTTGKTGCFIPEQWGMFPYVDEFGNSMVEEALEALNNKFAMMKKKLRPDLYQLEVSQHPRNIKEGFAHRDESKFPLHLVTMLKDRISNNEFPTELIDLDEDNRGELIVKRTTKSPILTFPVDPKMEDKTGSIVVRERPDLEAPWGTYLASIDPVSEGKTTTTDSLCAIYIYKTATEVMRTTENGTEHFVDGDKLVAWWCGRFDDINETHKRLRLMLQWYNAWAIVENNISLFIQYMILKNKQKYLVPKNEMLFLKEAQSNKNVYQDYGWRNVGVLFKNHLLSYLIEALKEVIDKDVDVDGEITKKHHGIVRFPDPMALVEMEEYREGVNVDRLVSLAALVAFVTIQKSKRRRVIREETIHGSLENSTDLYKLNKRPFRNVGRKQPQTSTRKRSAFKNIH